MSEGRTKRKESGHGVVEDLDAALNPARNYPRKRVAVACEVCRLRKTRCDSQRPCGFCKESRIECVYRQPNNSERQSSAADVLVRIEDRLARLEEFLNPTRSESAGTPSSLRRSSLDAPLPPARPRAFADGWRSYYQNALITPHYSFSFRQTAGEAVTARPSFVSFTSPFYLTFESWDDTERFYDDELVAEEKLSRAIGTVSAQSPRIDSRETWRLQQTFVKNFLQWMPLLEVGSLVQHVRGAQFGSFSESSPSNCLTMFAFAIAALSEDKGCTLATAQDEPLPGLDYFQKGTHILKSLASTSRRDIQILQCRVLHASYYQIALRPLLAWDSVTELARDCMHILSSGYFKSLDKSSKENFHRVFWICSILLHELESVLKTHPIGLRQFHEMVPLPLTEVEEEGFYYFLAQASLRKLLNEILDVVGYRVGQVIYAPVVATELRKQAVEWYDHLPPPVRFPINASPLFDLRKSFLRIQFIALHAVVLWPSVLQVLEGSVTRPHEPVHSNEALGDTQKESRDCITNCVICCDLTEELLMQRHWGLQFSLWASYSTLCKLMITYRVPALSFIVETTDDRYIRKAYRILKGWEHLPIVRRGLERTRAQMCRAQIPVDDL